jgi:uncharacterized repeat protein (TIGR01451 family)
VDITFTAFPTMTANTTYSATLWVKNDSPLHEWIAVPVEMMIKEATADLEVTASASTDLVMAGDYLTYTVVVTNRGPLEAPLVTLTDTLPANTSYVSGEAGCVEADGQVTCDLGTIAAGDSVTVTIVVKIATIGALVNTVDVSSPRNDPHPLDNSCTVNTMADSQNKLYLPLIRL